MKKKLSFNNKGFMLVEVIIVTVIVATIMISLYVVFNRVYNAYDLKEKYTDIDGIYGIKAVEDYFIDNMVFNYLIKDMNESSDVYVEVKCDGYFEDNALTYCDNIFSTYKVNKLYLVKKDGDQLPSDDKMPSAVNQTFIDYFDYVRNAIELENDGYIFLLETYELDSDKNVLNKYSYLEIK